MFWLHLQHEPFELAGIEFTLSNPSNATVRSLRYTGYIPEASDPSEPIKKVKKTKKKKKSAPPPPTVKASGKKTRIFITFYENKAVERFCRIELKFANNKGEAFEKAFLFNGEVEKLKKTLRTLIKSYQKGELRPPTPNSKGFTPPAKTLKP